MKRSSTLIGSRLAWCRLQRKQAVTKDEAERFLAEEEGLLDAMLGRNRKDMYSHDRLSRRESYETGLHDGQALMGLQQWNDTRQSMANDGGARAASFSA